MNTPFKCPVCLGTGNVPCGFYEQHKIDDNGRTWTTSSTTSETCRTCGGTGIVWSQQEDICIDY